eukprot:COSAG03_NODE_4013_length_1721_cov_2.426017_3_plen_206_part_00
MRQGEAEEDSAESARERASEKERESERARKRERERETERQRERQRERETERERDRETERQRQREMVALPAFPRQMGLPRRGHTRSWVRCKPSPPPRPGVRTRASPSWHRCLYKKRHLRSDSRGKERQRQAGRQAGRQASRQAGRQAGRQTDRQTDKGDREETEGTEKGQRNALADIVASGRWLNKTSRVHRRLVDMIITGARTPP